MNIVTEIKSTLLIEQSRELWKSISQIPLEYHNGVAILEDYLTVPVNIPWLSGKVGCIIFEPNSTCPIHCDDHEGVSYNRSLNILVESDGNNHSTRYYKWKHGDWNPKEHQALYDKDPADLSLIFEFTVKNPTIFYNQLLHDVNNYGNKRRVMIMWLIEKSVTDKEIFDWLNDNQMPFTNIYENK